MKRKLSTLGDFELMSTPAAVVLLATAVFTASVILAVMMVMVVAFGIGIISKVPCNKAEQRKTAEILRFQRFSQLSSSYWWR